VGFRDFLLVEDSSKELVEALSRRLSTTSLYGWAMF
jgi:hypothetical protein